MQAWIGEAQAGTHNLTEALKTYQKAAMILAADQAAYDDARCDLAMVETKIGSTLLKMGSCAKRPRNTCRRWKRLNSHSRSSTRTSPASTPLRMHMLAWAMLRPQRLTRPGSRPAIKAHD